MDSTAGAPVILLGPQQRVPTLNRVLKTLSSRRSVCAITAGWQEREGEFEELRIASEYDVVDLMLYHRTEEVFARDVELFDAHRRRQNRLQELQRLYRLRLAHALAAARELMAMEEQSRLLDAERRAALTGVRSIDRHHLRLIQGLHAEFESTWRPGQRPAVKRERQALIEALAGSGALLVAGGHVAVLLNRMRLFDLVEILRQRPIVAWSAGAMALGEKVVLFHDSPPQGAGNAEVLDVGLGLYRGIVPLPHARRRLRLHDPRRVALLARRFAPAHCVTLDDGSLLDWRGGRATRTQAVHQLMPAGKLIEYASA